MKSEQLDLFIADDDLNLLKDDGQSIEEYEQEKQEARERLAALANWMMSD